MKKLIDGFSVLFKKIIISFLIINTYNILCSSIVVLIPINVLNVILISFLGIPGIIAINILYFLI